MRICLEEDGIIYKITSIYLSSDGSFSIDIPSYPYREGLVMKFSPNYGPKNYLIAEDEFKQKLSSKNRPKLSIHSSGFVQFSGPGVRSGIDANTKLARGIGVYSAPLDAPVESGPTFGITFWGVKNFEKTSKLKKGDILIKQEDLINRPNPDNPEVNTYIFEGWVFHERFKKYIRDRNNREEATIGFPQYRESPGAIFTFPIVRLCNYKSFIGILPFRTNTELPNKEDSGFNFGGPGGTDSPSRNGPINVIMAWSSMGIFDSKENLNYETN
jgi:hypothetical protein